jgi:hypothetical protein
MEETEELESAWSKRLQLTEERPPQPADFPANHKEQSRLVLQNLLAIGQFPTLPHLLVLLCEHSPLPRKQKETDPLLRPEDSAGEEMLWSTPEHGDMAERVLQKILEAERGSASLTQLLGIDLKHKLTYSRRSLSLLDSNPVRTVPIGSKSTSYCIGIQFLLDRCLWSRVP